MSKKSEHKEVSKDEVVSVTHDTEVVVKLCETCEGHGRIGTETTPCPVCAGTGLAK